MTRHFGVLIPSTNTTVEIECRLLPAGYQAHVGRLLSSGGSFSPSRDEDIEYQSRLLGTAKVELVILAQTSASLFADDYDDVVTKRMSAGAGVPAITSAQAVGRAVRALKARRIAIVSPYSDAVNERAARYFKEKHQLATRSRASIDGRSRRSSSREETFPRCRRSRRGSDNSESPW
jgi:maleate isomerase